MNVVDIPQPAPAGMYEEAVSRYAACVKNRAVAVYRLARATYPGFPELAPLVITEHVGVDNRFFFSALHRLPERYHRLFLCEPLIVPGWSLRVMRYTAHDAPELVGGRQVLQAFAQNEERDERWYRVLEWYCAYAWFAQHTRRSQLLKGRETLAGARALRALLAKAAPLIPQAADDAYAKNIEGLCRTFFDDQSDPVEGVREAWELFSGAFDRFDRVMQEHLGAANTEHAVATARARLRGEEQCEDFDREYAFRRARDIDGYRQDLASLGFPYGDLFPEAAHPQEVRTPAAAPLLEGLLRSVYRVRRRIMEYAAG